MAAPSQPATARVPGALAQMRLIAGVRWRMFANSLGTWQARLDLLARAGVVLLFGFLALLIGAGLAALTYLGLAMGRPGFVAAPLWFVFAAWQVIPLLMATFGQHFPVRDLLRYPLRFPSFFWLTLAYGLFDPAALAALLWLGCIAAAVLAAGGGHLPVVLAAFPLFALVNLALGRAVSVWLDRLLARRRSKEALLAGVVILAFGLQFGVVLAEEYLDVRAAWRVLAPLAGLLPPGLVAAALERPGDTVTLFSAAAMLGAFAALFAILLGARLRRQFRGEDLGESPAPARAEKNERVAGWHLPRLPAAAAATFEKDIRYIQRSTMQVINAFLPVIFVLLMVMLTGRGAGNAREAEFFARVPDLMLPGMVAYTLTVLVPPVYNAFAFDGRGIQFLFAAPVRFREVLLGKNLAHAAVVVFDVLLIGLMLALMGRPPGLWVALASLGALGVCLPAHYALGNVLSLNFPRALDFEKMKQQMRPASILLFLALHVALMLFCALVYAIGLGLGRPWMAVVLLALLSVTSWRAYLHFLERTTQLALAKRDILCQEIAKG